MRTTRLTSFATLLPAAVALAAAAAPAAAGAPAVSSAKSPVFAAGPWTNSLGRPPLSPDTVPMDPGEVHLVCPWDYEGLAKVIELNPYEQWKIRNTYAAFRRRHAAASARAAELSEELRRELSRQAPRRDRVAALLGALGQARTKADGAYTLMQVRCWNTLGALQKWDVFDFVHGLAPTLWDWAGFADADEPPGARPDYPVVPPRPQPLPPPHYLHASAALPTSSTAPPLTRPVGLQWDGGQRPWRVVEPLPQPRPVGPLGPVRAWSAASSSPPASVAPPSFSTPAPVVSASPSTTMMRSFRRAR